MIGRILGVLLTLLPLVATAQPPARRGPLIVLEETIIHGRPQRPNAFYILHRASLGYRVDDLRTHFTQAIVQSVTRRPF